MSTQLKKLFLFLLPMGFIPYILICFYNNPNADDFLCAVWAKKGPLFNIWVDQYYAIGGRYTSNFLILVNPLTYDSFRLYRFVPLLVIVLHWFSMKGLIKSLIGKYISQVDLYLCTYLLVFLFIYQMPIISEGLYWYTGQVVYMAGCISATVFLTMLVRFFQNQYILNSKFIHAVALGLLVIITNGFNEVLMLMMNVFLVGLLFVLIREEFPHKLFITCILIISLTSSCLMIFAPGVYVRSGHYPDHHQLGWSLLMSLAQMARFFGTWIVSAPLWILSFAYYFLHYQLVEKIPLFKESFYLNVYTSTNLLFFIIFLSVFPAYWATGILGQHRTLNVAYYFFIPLWFVNLTVWFNWMETRSNQIKIPNKGISIVLFTILMGCFLFVKNGFYTSTDIISGRAANYDKEMHRRYALMKSDTDTIYFTPIKNPPKSLSFYEVTTDPKDWLNAGWVSYFGKEGGAWVILKN